MSFKKNMDYFFPYNFLTSPKKFQFADMDLLARMQIIFFFKYNIEEFIDDWMIN